MTFAQSTTQITGKVMDEDNQPFPGANVYLKGTTYGDNTNQNGEFRIVNAPEGTYDLVVSFIGYKNYSQTITLGAGQQITLDIQLEEESLTLDNLLVTAQKREQITQEIPVAITSWEGNFLTDRGLFEMDAFSDYVPGLQVQVQSVNNPGFVIRGITSDNGDSRVEPRVSVFQDGVSISKSRGSIVEVFDMERIEVLKGPQGTLFGRGAQIGAVHFIQNKPKNKYEGELTLGIGNEGQYLANGFVNAPIIKGKLMARVAAIYNTRDGVIENISGGDLNGKNTFAIRPSLRWVPGDRTTVDLIVNYQRDTPPGTSFKSGTYAPLGGNTSPFTFADMERGDDLFIERTVWGTTLLVDHSLSDRFNLTSITAYREFDSFESFDADGTAAPVLWFAEDAEGRQFSQEFRFNYTDQNRFSGFFGTSFFLEDGSQSVPFETNEQSLFALFSGFFGVPELFVPLVQNGVPTLVPNIPNVPQVFGPLAGLPLKEFHSESSTNFGNNYAFEIFADGTFDITDKFKVTAGLRGTYENITSALQVDPAENPGTLGFVLGTFPNNLFTPTDGRQEANETFFSAVGRLALNYEINDQINVFGSFSRGRRPNVVQVTASAVDVLNDETVWSYEVGGKSLFFNNRLQFDLNGFYYDYNNFQTSVFIITEDGLQNETRDVGSATALGFETAFRYVVNNYISVFANYGFIDATFDDEGSDGNAQALAGNRFRLTPKHSASLGFDLNVPLAGENLEFFLRPTFTYKSQVFFEEANQPGIEQDGYGLLNIFAGFNLLSKKLL